MWLSFPVGNVAQWSFKTLRVLNNTPRQYKKSQELMIQLNLLIFSQCKYSLANAKYSPATKQEEINKRTVLYIFLAPGAIPRKSKSDFQQEPVGRAVLNPDLLSQAPACPTMCWDHPSPAGLHGNLGRSKTHLVDIFLFLEEFYSRCLEICLVRLQHGWKEMKNGPEKSSVTEQTT